MRNDLKLDDLIRMVLEAMAEQKYSQRTIKNYRHSFSRLKHISKEMGVDHPTPELFSVFQADVGNTETGQPDVIKKRQHIRSINLLTSLMENGSVDWSRKRQGDVSALVKEPAFRLSLEKFLSQLAESGLSLNTICGYKRIVSYFLIFCQEKGYKDISGIQTNDVSMFIVSLYQKGRFKPATISGTLPGLRQFLSSYDDTRQFLLELPTHLPHERNIIDVYDEQECRAIKDLLTKDILSKRNLAIDKLLLETGLRGVDICEMKLKDICWEKDVIQVVQAKTKYPLTIPLRSSYGNAIVDYILNERPDGDSDYLFLRSLAPFEKLGGSGAIWPILQEMERKAGIQKEGRISGSRMTRRNAASTMLRAGVPMSDISAVLGHRNPTVVTVYLSTDKESLASCTLPLPPVRKGVSS
ncbi:MAG: site-specific integrase [Peptococcaceae bacterium]|nr:site-specific integrase [Peptococcaceae bacterium]